MPQSLPNLPENTWVSVNEPLSSAVPDSQLYPVLNIGNSPRERGITNWSGGCLRESTNELIVWGGGHFASASNAVYSYNILRPEWKCLKTPSSVEGFSNDTSSGAYPDGRPISRHSYYMVVDCPDYNAFWTQGGSLYPGGESNSFSWMYEYNQDWKKKFKYEKGNFFSSAAYHKKTKKVIVHIFDKLFAHDLQTDTVETLYRERSGNWQYRAMVIDETKDRAFIIGVNSVSIYDLVNRTKQELVPTGDTEVISENYISAVLDTKRNRILLWNKLSAPHIYSMDMETLVIKKMITKGTAPVFPSNYTGTYGRFQYCKELDSVVVMLDSYGPVYYLKLSDSGVSTDSNSGGEPVIIVGDGPMIRLESTGNLYSSLSLAEKAAIPGDTITLSPWVYLRETSRITKPLTIRCDGTQNRRAILDAYGTATDGKGILVVTETAGNVTLENLELTGAKVSSTNGAGLRAQGSGTVIINNCYFHHNENGILASNPNMFMEVNDCVFSDNGHSSGQSHNLYITIKRLIMRRTVSRDSFIGHCVKSRSDLTLIRDCWLYDEKGRSSMIIDISTGGDFRMSRTVVRQGPPGENRHLIKFGAEGLRENTIHSIHIHQCFLFDDIGGFLINTFPENVAVNGNNFNGRVLTKQPTLTLETGS